VDAVVKHYDNIVNNNASIIGKCITTA